MNLILRALLLVVGITVSLAANASVLDTRSYGTTVASCQVVAHRVASHQGFEDIQRQSFDLLPQVMASRRAFKGRDSIDASETFNKVNQRIEGASVQEIKQDFASCARWINGR